MKRVAIVGILVAVLIAAAAFLFVRASGGFSARDQPSRIEATLARAARRWAMPRAARDARNQVEFSQEAWAEGRAHFADHCASCHANDGSGQTEMGQNLYPRAPDMRLAATQKLTDGELYWIIENGIRFTGMPAWGKGGGNDADTWTLVHVIRQLKAVTPEQLKEMEGMNPRSPAEIQEELDDQRFLSGQDVAPPHSH